MCVLGHRDVGHHRVAIARDKLTIARHLERAIAGEARHTRGQRHFNVALALDREVQIAARCGQRPLVHIHRHSGRPHTKPQLHTSRDNRPVRRGDRARARHLLIMQVRKLSPSGVITSRVHIREVVGNHLNSCLLGAHARGCDLECTHVGLLFLSANELGHRAHPLVLPLHEALAHLVGVLHLDHPRNLRDRIDV